LFARSGLCSIKSVAVVVRGLRRVPRAPKKGCAEPGQSSLWLLWLRNGAIREERLPVADAAASVEPSSQ